MIEEYARHNGHADLLRESDLFDEEFYLQQLPKLREQGKDPVTHYLKRGGFNGNQLRQLASLAGLQFGTESVVYKNASGVAKKPPSSGWVMFQPAPLENAPVQ